MQAYEQLPPRDTEEVRFPGRSVSIDGPEGPIGGHMATPPDGVDWRSAVVVVGDDAHARSVCAGLAAAGHGAVTVAVDLSPLEGASELQAASRAALKSLTQVVEVAAAFLRTQSGAPGRLGVVGYGPAGIVALTAGYRCQVGAAVSFYGEGPRRLRANLKLIIEKPKRHAAGLVCLLGGEDPDVSPADLGAIREHLDGFGMRHTMIVYPRTRSGFCDPEATAYRESEAADAWSRMLHALSTAPRLRHRFPTVASRRT